MKNLTPPNPKKAAQHESRGDEFLAKGKAAKALAEYRKSLEQEPARPGLFDKLTTARDQAGGEWQMKDFAESVSWTMEKQAQESPAVRQVHAKLSPEWHRAMELVLQLVQSEGEIPCELIEKLVDMGEIGTRALVAVILDFKQVAAERPEGPAT